MESFPPESAEHAAKKQKQESSHKRVAVTVDEFPDDAKRQAAEIVYLERYE
jgi:hypothetical protein